jgi:exopolyphosphatase/guanosine-5'-triphosphate,3'-diphosphate pyrophosphatase
LTERFGDLAGGAPGTPARVAAAEARASVAEILAPLREARPITELRCVAGTPLTIGAIAFRSTVNDVSGRELKRAQIDGVITRLLELTLEERKAVPGMIAQRADVLPAGGIIVSEALRLLACDSARLESDDLLLGFLLGPRTA